MTPGLLIVGHGSRDAAANAEFEALVAECLIIGSWYGKRFRPERVKARGGWDAIRTAHVYEIKSADILQPGPAALTDGLAQIYRIIRRWSEETTR